MSDVSSLEFQALNEFKKSVKKNLAKGNSEVVIANVIVKYNWRNYTNDIQTKAMIQMENRPFAKISLEDSDWLTAETFYTEFQIGYNLKFNYNIQNNILKIESDQPSKMGDYYSVEITEV